MTNKEKLVLVNSRIAKLQGRGDKNIKSQGTMKKLLREKRNLEKTL